MIPTKPPETGAIWIHTWQVHSKSETWRNFNNGYWSNKIYIGTENAVQSGGGLLDFFPEARLCQHLLRLGNGKRYHLKSLWNNTGQYHVTNLDFADNVALLSLESLESVVVALDAFGN